MECKNVLENLSAYLDGELDENSAQEIRQHMNACLSCRKEAKLYSQTWDLLGKVPDLKPNIESSARIREQVRRLQAGNSRKLHWLKISLLSAAACLVVALVAYIVIPQSNPSDIPAPQVEVNNVNNEEQQIKLEYYKQLLASYQTVNDEAYWCGETTKTVSPYLSSEEWKSIE